MKPIMHQSWLRRFRAAAAVALCALAGTWAPAAVAAPPEAPRFAILDVQQVLRESTAVKGLNAEIEKRRDEYQDELRQHEESLRQADQELSRQRTVISAEAFAQKRKELEQRVGTLQREVQERKRMLDRGFSKGLSQVQAEMANIARAIASEMELDLILSKATVVIVKPELEVTAEVTKRLNQSLPAVAVDFPQ